jgi:hypothetical protein
MWSGRYGRQSRACRSRNAAYSVDAMKPLRALLPFARRAPQRRENHARCELCAAPVAERHGHVVLLERHELQCACTACAVLFRDAHAGNGRYRTVPDRVIAARASFACDADWTRLEIPVQLAFVVRRERWIAMYPSPAGTVEAPLSDAASAALAELVPLSAKVEPEVEALLIHRPRRGANARCHLVPIDACYELVAIVRRQWRGFDGGDEARAAIDTFIARLDGAAQQEKP